MEKPRWEESKKRKWEGRRQRRERVRRKKVQAREKAEKSQNTLFFQSFVAPEDRKVGSLKRRMRSHLARWEMKNCTRNTFPSQKAKDIWPQEHFWKSRCRKTARCCGAKHIAKSTPFSENFWKSSCWKSARRCGAKHISKSKCKTRTMPGELLEVEMFKKCTPLWCEARCKVKMGKKSTWSDHFWRFGCGKVRTVVARNTFRSQKRSTTCSNHLWTFNRTTLRNDVVVVVE